MTFSKKEANRIPLIKDSILTSQHARVDLYGDKIKIIKYRNQENSCAVVHSHPYRELIIPLSGSSVRYSVGGAVFNLGVGQMIMLPEEIYHSAKFNVMMDYSERLVLQVDQESWKIASNLCDLQTASWQNEILILQESAVMDWKVKELFERMGLSKKIKNDGEQIVLYCHLMELVVLLDQAVSVNGIGKASESSQLVAQATAILQARYTDPTLTISKIASDCFTSREHLSRVFKAYTLQSIHEYLTELRMQHFRGGLGEGQTILEACNASGFPDYSSFVKCFRKLYGITPSDYRKQIRNGRERQSTM